MKLIPPLLTLLLSVGLLHGTDKSTASLEQAAVPEDVNEAVRSFLIGAITIDEDLVRNVALPHPQLSVLLSGSPLPKALLETMKKQFATMPCLPVKVGDRIKLPHGKSIEVTKEMVNADRGMFRPVMGGEPAPFPIIVVRTNGQWRVDAESVIAARLASKL